MPLRFWILPFLLVCASGCSTTPTPPVAPPQVGSLLQPEKVEGRYTSVEALKADPSATFGDAYTLMHDLEAALRRANRDQTDALQIIEAEAPKPVCSFWKRVSRRC